MEKNPIIIELEGTEHKFETINRHSDIPQPKRLLDSVLKTMETDADWDNLPTLLAGYTKAGINLRGSSQGKITRVAHKKDKLRVILESAKQSSSTGFFIASREQLAYIQMGICNRLDAAAGDVQRIESCVKMANLMLTILLQPDHIAHHKSRSKGGWLQNSVLFRSLLVHSRAHLYKAKKATGEPVEAELLLLTDEIKALSTLWARHSELEIDTIPDFYETFPVSHYTQEPQSGDRRSDFLGEGHYVAYLARHIQAIELVDKLALEHPDDFASVSAEIKKHLVPAIGKVESHLVQLVPKTKNQENLSNIYSQILGRKLAI